MKLMPKNNAVEEVIVLGTGPAGLTAALYAARADLNPLVLTGTAVGGQAAITGPHRKLPRFPEWREGLRIG